MEIIVVKCKDASRILLSSSDAEGARVPTLPQDVANLVG